MNRRGRSRLSNLHRVETEYGVVILNEASGAYWHLNESADVVLSVLERGGNIEEATDALVQRYGIEPDRARADVEDIRGRLDKVRIP